MTDPMMPRSCGFCKHYKSKVDKVKKELIGYCIAFPDEIPAKYEDNYFEHTEVLPEQTGDYVFEPRDYSKNK